MRLNEAQIQFVTSNRSAAMITTGSDGIPKAVRVGVAFVDGKLWSSGTRNRIRTRRLREDPRCTLFVFEPGYQALTIETAVTIIDGSVAADHSVRLFRTMQARPDGPLSWFGRELDEDAFRLHMIEEERLIYEFDVDHAYGLS